MGSLGAITFLENRYYCESHLMTVVPSPGNQFTFLVFICVYKVILHLFTPAVVLKTRKTFDFDIFFFFGILIFGQ